MEPALDPSEAPLASVTADTGSSKEDETSPPPTMEDQDEGRELNTSYVAPAVVQSPFPYLITSGLSAGEKESLLERLMIESADIRLKFCTLASNFHGSLLLRNVDTTKLNDEVRNFHPYYYERIYKYRATDITTAMGLLHNNLNFHFYDVLSHVITKLGTVDDKQALLSYQNTHAEFSKRRLFECPTGVFGGSRWEHEEEMIVKKLNRNKSINDVTLADLSVFVEQLRKEVKVDEFSMRLLGVAVEEGSTLLYFALDMSLVNSDATFPLSHELKLRLIDMGVWHVSCGEFIFQHKPKVRGRQ